MTERKYYFQIDALKAMMIVLVIITHSVTIEDIFGKYNGSFWIRIAIPVFLIIMGFNMGLSFKQKGNASLRELYSASYFKNKLERYVVPFLILAVVSTVIGLLLYGLDFSTMIETEHEGANYELMVFLLFLPFHGPGNWFIITIFQFIVVIPILFWSFDRRPKTILVLALVSDIIIQQVVYYLYYFNKTVTIETFYDSFIFRTSIVWFLTAVVLGLWFSKYGHNIRDKTNWFILILLPVSLIFIAFFQSRVLVFGSRVDIPVFGIIDIYLFGDYHFMFFPYAAFLFLLGMTFIPENSSNMVTKLVEKTGRATYHILLFQILYLAIFEVLFGTAEYVGIGEALNQFISLPWDIIIPVINIIVCIALGILWYEVEKKLKKTMKRREAKALVNSII
ncbi:MAG: acyltransferase family protein [Candidatus Odinarchaeota archaeon]